MKYVPLSWINGVNSTSLKVVTGCALALLLILFYCGVQGYETLVRGKPIDPLLFAEALTFAAAFAGIAYRQFAKKRETEIVTPPQTTAEHSAPVPVPALTPPATLGNVTAERPAIPQAGVKLSDPAVVAGLETLAAKQRDDDEGVI